MSLLDSTMSLQNKTAAIYVRVSTDNQDVTPQLKPCQDWCIAQGIPYEVYPDVISGTKTSRPALDRMMSHVRAGVIQVVVCFKLDRLGRSVIHLVETIREFDRMNVAFVCPSQGVDTRQDNPAGRLQINILASVAEFERALIVERTKAGLASARSQGRVGGRKTGQIPKTYKGQPVIKIDIPQVTLLVAQGKTWREAGKQLGYKRSTLYLRLKEAGWFGAA